MHATSAPSAAFPSSEWPESPELARILQGFNQAVIGPASQDCVHQLFEAQVQRTPQQVALVWGETRLSYAELDQAANRVAHFLRAAGVTTEALVGISLPRNAAMLVWLLGILKAGAAYVPLDPAYPPARLQWMVQHAQLGWVVGLADSALALPGSTRLLAIDAAATQAEVAAHVATPLPCAAIGLSARNLAYVLYTSGSTGLPKGVMVEHASVSSLVSWLHSLLGADEIAHFLASTSLNFDLSVAEIFTPLCAGGCVVLLDQVLDLLHAEVDISLLNSVPSALKALAEAGAIPPSVQTIIACGEPLKQTVVDLLYRQGVARVYDFYGPTEDTVYSTHVLRRAGGQHTIGRTKPDTFAFILDQALKPVAPGAAGELYLAGNGLARGYLHAPELTRERFVPNPFARFSGPRLYRTGDLARWTPDGQLVYLGRVDHQVQIHGHRVEVAEIEATLQKLAGVDEAVVVARGEPLQLVAYLTSKPGSHFPPPDAARLRQKLEAELPAYMLPRHFVMLEHLPQTANGKLDRAALPMPAALANESVHTLFEQHAAARPDACAVIGPHARYSYAELDAAANALAHTLTTRGLPAGSHIGVCLGHGAELVAAILAIWKAGMVYVPLDPACPQARLQFMLQDAGIALVISDAAHRARAGLPAASSILPDATPNTTPGRNQCRSDSRVALVAQPEHYLTAKCKNSTDKEPNTILNTAPDAAPESCPLPHLGTLLLTPGPGAQSLHNAASLNHQDCSASDHDHASPLHPGPHTVAYLIYTSGSSGEPKGVLAPHRSVCNRLRWLHETYPTAPDEVFSFKTGIGFVDHIAEIFQALCFGAPLLIAREQLHDIDDFIDLLQQHRVTRLTLVPTLLQTLLDSTRLAKLPHLRLLISSGEALPLKLAQACRAALPHTRLLNLYGSTESGADISHFEYTGESPIWPGPNLPAGRAIANNHLYVLDPQGHPLPAQQEGELFASGAGLALGYWQRPALTQQTFVPNPFVEDDGCAKLYRTGDRACWLADGTLMLLGRSDSQIKIHGCRIEAGEIEAHIRAEPGVQAALVLPEPGAQRILAFVQAAETQPAQYPLLLALLRMRLQQALPSWAQVSQWLVLPQFPLLPNGKIDKQQLLGRVLQAKKDAASGAAVADTSYAAINHAPGAAERTPNSPDKQQIISAAIARIWQQMLGNAPLDWHSGFLNQGGSSMQVIRMVMLLRREGIILPAQAVFDNLGIPALAQQATESGTRISTVASTPANMSGKMANPAATTTDNTMANTMVSPGFAPAIGAPAKLEGEQERGPWPLLANHHWFLQRANYHHWNASHLYQLDATLDLSALRQAMGAVLAQHPGLRMQWLKGPDGYAWQVLPPDAMAPWWLPLNLASVAEEQEAECITRICNTLQASLDIHRCLFKLVIFDFGPSRARRMLVLAHHLIMDAHSYTIVLADLARAVQQLQQGHAPQLPLASTSLAEWSQWQAAWAQSDALTHLPYWQNPAWQRCRSLPADDGGPLALDIGLSLPQIRRHVLDAASSESLQACARQHGLPLAMLVLAGVVAAYRHWTGQDCFAVNWVHHGRLAPKDAATETQIELSHTVGWLANYSLALLQLNVVPGNVPSANDASAHDASAHDASATVLQLAQTVASQMGALQDDGLSYSCLKFLNRQAEVQATMQAVPPAQIEFNFTPPGEYQHLPPWLQEAQEDMGSNDGLMHSGFAPFVKAHWIAGQLTLDWGWCPTRYRASTIDALARTSLSWYAQWLQAAGQGAP